MSGLQARAEDHINGVDVREQGRALRVVTNTPHLVSLGTGRLSTAVTLHPIKQGRVTIGSDPTCDIYVVGTGVASVHSRVENSHGVVTLYPVSGSTLLDGLPVDKPTRLSQGSMLTIGRSNYLRFNHPEEAKLMKSVLPGAHISMAPIQFTPNEDCRPTGYQNHNMDPNDCYQNSNMQQKIYKDNTLKQLDQELDNSIKELGRKKPPVAPKKPFRDLEYSDSNSDQESQKPKMSSIMAKVSKFEYYAKTQQKSRSQFYTHENEISPKVFSSNSLTVNTPAVDVLGGKNTPTYLNSKENNLKLILSENNSVDPRKCSYANVAIRNRTKIDEIVRNFDESTQNKLPKKINNDQIRHDHIYGKINSDHRKPDNTSQECPKTYQRPSELCMESSRSVVYARIADKTGNIRVPCLPSPAFDRNPQYSPVYANSSQYDRSLEAENRRKQAYKERVEEEEQKDAENARLEEILNMCAEYERQIATGTPNTPTEKKSQNKIITNGSLPRSVALNNPNFVQTSEGYYKFDTSHNRNNSSSRSLPLQRNLSSYENFDVTQISNSTDPNTPEVTISNQSYGNSGRMDEIGIPVFEGNKHELSSPIMIRRIQNNDKNSLSPIGSPYENVYNRGNLKPKSPNTQSPRTRIKTSFAHKNLPSPQYFIFPTPPPVDNSRKPNFVIPEENDKTADAIKVDENNKKNAEEKPKFEGIEKQLSLEEEIPMIDDASLADDIEFRYSKVLPESDDVKKEIQKNQSFDDVRKELMADIPELDDFEKDLQKNRDKVVKNITDDIKKMDADVASIESTLTIDVNINELRGKYDVLKEERRKLVAEIHEHKCKMSEIRSQEDDILRELEMEKALIKGEYDSEIAILNIEQKKKSDLLEQAKRLETEIRQLKDSQHTRQNEMHERVEIATTKVERIEKDVKQDVATMEELQNAKDILENESKMSEDLEFQHLEEESELLANREDIQNEIIVLSKKIDSQKNRILTLKSEANNNLTSALDETKILQAEYVRLLNRVEDLTTKVQTIEKELKPLVAKLNDIERTQSPDSAFFTDQTRAKSGEFGYSPQSSDSDDLDLTKLTNFQDHSKQIKDKFNSIDQMSQSMIVDIERRDITELLDEVDPRSSESPSKSSTSSKEKKGFWERNFDSLSRRRSKDKKPKSPEKVDIMSQSLNENLFYNNENIETDNFDRYNSLRTSNSKKEKHPVQKSNSSSKIPTFAALTKIIKKDSFKKHNETDDSKKNRYVKNGKQINEHKYAKSKNSPEKITELPEDVKDDTPNQKGHNVTFDEVRSKSSDVDSTFSKVLHRKSCGDEPNMRCDFQKISDSGKIPSQDDIDRISKVTIDAPILGSDADMNSLGKKTYDSLMEIERKRLMMLEEQGCQVIENEREKISELKRRVQDETKKLWDQKYKNEQTKSFDSDTGQLSMEFDSSLGPNDSLRTNGVNERNGESSATDDPFNLTGSTIFEESSGLMSSSIEELQVRNSRTESNEDDKRSDDSRPLSHASDFSRDNILSLSNAPRRSRRAIAPYSESQRPLTRYLPVDRDDFDLRRHVESAGHQVDVCPHVIVTASCCRGYLHKLGAKFHTWSKRWFVFDRDTKTFVYYWDKSEKKPRGGAYFQVIEEVYLDHGNTSKSPNPQTTFIVKTRQRRYYLMAPSGEAARMWIDVIFTGAQGYTEYME